MLFAPDRVAALSGIPPASPRLFSDLQALLLTAVGAGFCLPWRDPDRHRAYLWLFGVAIKAAGAAAFLLHFGFRGSPRSVLLLAATDAVLALLTAGALVLGSTPASRRR